MERKWGASWSATDCANFEQQYKQMINTEKKIRVLHSASLLTPPSGILAQMSWEQEAADALDIDWRVRMYCPNNTPNRQAIICSDDAIDHKKISSSASKFLAWFRLRKRYYEWLLRQQHQVDIYLLRYYVHDPFQLAFVRACKRPVYFVHHTFEVDELELPGGLVGFVRAYLEKIIGKYSIRNAAGIIGMTQEIVNYELERASSKFKKCYVYPNGIVLNDSEVEDRRNTDVPELLFIANFAPWHGLDLLLNQVQKSKENFVLHLVGEVPTDLLAFTQDHRIRVHGPLDQQQIRGLSAQCWVGLASFALRRKKMKQACPLKVREYLMLGLPVYGDYKDVFNDDFLYFKHGSEELTEIIDFCRHARRFEKKEVIEASRNLVDKKTLLAELYQKLLVWGNDQSE